MFVLTTILCIVYVFHENIGKKIQDVTDSKSSAIFNGTHGRIHRNLTYNRKDLELLNILNRTFDVHKTIKRSQETSPGSNSSSNSTESIGLYEDFDGNCESMKFLVYACEESRACGEWGDMQTGIVSTYLLSLLMERTFVIHPDISCDLSKIMIPVEYNWMICQEFILSLSKTRIKTFDVIDNAEEYRNLVENAGSGMFSHNQIIFIQTNQLWNDFVMAHLNPEVENKDWSVGKTVAEVSKLTLEMLFKPSEFLENEIRKITDSLSPSEKLICGDVYGNKIPSVQPHPRGDPAVTAINAIFKFLKAFDNPSRYTIYVSTSSASIQAHFAGLFFNALNVDLPSDKHTEQMEPRYKSLYEQIFKQNILLQCDVLLLTDSELGLMAAYRSEKMQTLFYFLDEGQSVIKITRKEIPYYQAMVSKPIPFAENFRNE